MNIHPVCMACMVGQIQKAYQLLHPDAKNDEILTTQKKIMIEFGKLKQKATPYYGKLLYQMIGEAFGEDDPYFDLKKKFNDIALKLAPQLKDYVKQSNNPLLTAVVVAILGNCVDFGTPHQINLEQDVKNFSLDMLIINHFPEFQKDFNAAKKILIIGDNTGEIVLDKILLDYLIEHYPQKQIIYAVRGGPAINDATIEDAKYVGITEICQVVEGSASPGVIFEEAGPEFQDAIQTSDLIISKGQGNFESLDDFSLNRGELYFFLKAKCDLVAGMFGVPVGSLILYHRKQQKQ
jgi:damage-control phosphatase, subfamily I